MLTGKAWPKERGFPFLKCYSLHLYYIIFSWDLCFLVKMHLFPFSWMSPYLIMKILTQIFFVILRWLSLLFQFYFWDFVYKGDLYINIVSNSAYVLLYVSFIPELAPLTSLTHGSHNNTTVRDCRVQPAQQRAPGWLICLSTDMKQALASALSCRHTRGKCTLMLSRQTQWGGMLGTLHNLLQSIITIRAPALTKAHTIVFSKGSIVKLQLGGDNVSMTGRMTGQESEDLAWIADSCQQLMLDSCDFPHCLYGRWLSVSKVK